MLMRRWTVWVVVAVFALSTFDHVGMVLLCIGSDGHVDIKTVAEQSCALVCDGEADPEALDQGSIAEPPGCCVDMPIGFGGTIASATSPSAAAKNRVSHAQARATALIWPWTNSLRARALTPPCSDEPPDDSLAPIRSVVLLI